MEWDSDLPRWGDAGRRVLLEKKGGARHEGALDYDDTAFDGEDEHPVWYVEDDNGERMSLTLFDEWKFIDEGSQLN